MFFIYFLTQSLSIRFPSSLKKKTKTKTNLFVFVLVYSRNVNFLKFVCHWFFFRFNSVMYKNFKINQIFIYKIFGITCSFLLYIFLVLQKQPYKFCFQLLPQSIQIVYRPRLKNLILYKNIKTFIKILKSLAKKKKRKRMRKY